MKKIVKSIKRIILFVFLLAIMGITYIIYDGYSLYKKVVSEVPIANKIETIKSDDSYITYEEIPTLFLNAIVAVEDHRFYKHNGFDIISFGRAVLQDIQKKDFVQGGSTITQQLAKNMYFNFEKKITRKVAELLVAFDLEKNYSKQDILTFYTNTVYFGDGYYGLEEASKGYYGKEAKDLSDDEITLLAGVPNAPSAYALSSHEDLARKRQQVVISCLKEYENMIDEEKENVNIYE